ncbi:mucin-binding protein, partial [Apilactobacillus sp. 1-1-2]|uniref:mucin-binding protein n=1 Tax=Apilactobacillus sp. 1-1-2 TaxID=3411035 RepID=UPI003B947768
MKYNKRKLNKVNDKKIMKKVKKNWIVVSLGFFTLLGTGLYFEYNQTTVSADSISNVQSKSTSDAKLNENDEKISPNPSNSINTINEKGVSVKQEYSDYTRYIDYQEAYSNLSTSGKTLADQRIDSVHYVRTKVFDSSNNLIGYSSDGSNNADISLNDSQNGWRPKSNTSSTLPEISSPSISGYGDPSISEVKSSFIPGQGFTDSGNPDVTISDGDTGQRNAIEHVKVFYTNPLSQYSVKTQYANLTRQIDYVEDSNQATSGTHIYPTRYDHIGWVRNIVQDKDGNVLGYSTTNSTNINISKSDSNNGWRLLDNSPSSIPDASSPNDSTLTEKGYSGPDVSVVSSTYSPDQGFSNPSNLSNVAIFDGKDSNGNVIEKNAYELVTVKYKNMRTSQNDYSNLTRQIDYVNRNDFVDDGNPIPAGYHIYPSRKDTVKYIRTRVYDTNGNLIGYSSTGSSNNVDIPLDDLSQGWHLAQDSPQNEIPTAYSPTVDGYTNPSYSSFTSEYAPGDGFNNKYGKPNVVINGVPANTYEYVKVVYGRDSNVVKIDTKTLTRTVKYVDKSGKEIVAPTIDNVTYKRAEVYSPDGSTLLGYSSNLDNSKTPDISTSDPNQGWIQQTNDLKSYNVQDLSKYGYSNPDTEYITSSYSGKDGFSYSNNYKNSKIYNDNNNEDITVTYSHKVDTVTPDQPGEPGQPINPANPDGPKWPNGTDKDSLSKSVNQTINYVDGNGKSVHDASHDQVTF